MDALKSVELLCFEPKTNSVQARIMKNVVENKSRHGRIFGYYERQANSEAASCKKKIEKSNPVPRKRTDVPIWEKSYLTLDEAAAYSGIGRDKLRKMSNREDCPFVLWNNSKRLIKRRKLDEFLDRAYSI